MSDDDDSEVVAAALKVVKGSKKRKGPPRSAIGSLCEAIVGDPESSLQKTKASGTKEAEESRVEQLMTLARQPGPENEPTRRLALLSLCAVFLDILPGYRLRLPTAQEKSQRTTKDVAELRRHEAALLAAYGHYVKLLSGLVGQQQRNASNDGGGDKDRATAVRCLGQLLVGRPRFNLRDQVLTMLVTASDDRLQSVCEDAAKSLSEAAEGDKQGDVSVAVARAVNKLVRDKRCKLRSDACVRVLGGLQLVAVDDVKKDEKVAVDALNNALREKAKKKKRFKVGTAELLRETKQAKRAIEENDAVVNAVDWRRTQRELTNDVTLVYARILKTALDGYESDPKLAKAASKLLPATLLGLSKIAHAINADVVLEVLELLRKLVKPPIDDEDLKKQKQPVVLAAHVALRCALCALEALQGAGSEYNVDDKAFVAGLYDAVLRFAAVNFADDEHAQRANFGGASLALSCISAVTLGHRREIVAVRTAAFARRCMLIAAHSPKAPEAAAFLSLVRGIFNRYTLVMERILEDDESCSLGEMFKASTVDPDASAALSTPAWELALLARHFDPRVAAQAQGILDRKPMTPADDHRKLRETIQRADPICFPTEPRPLRKKKRTANKRKQQPQTNDDKQPNKKKAGNNNNKTTKKQREPP